MHRSLQRLTNGKCEALEHSVLNGMSSSNHSLKGPGLRRIEGDNDSNSRRWKMTPKKQCLLDIIGLIVHMNSRDCGSTHRTYTVQAQLGCSTKVVKWNKIPYPNQEATCNWHLLAKGKVSYLWCSCQWIYQPYTRTGPMSRNNWPTQLNQCLFGRRELLIFVWHFCLFDFLVFINFFLFLRERRRKKSKLDG